MTNEHEPDATPKPRRGCFYRYKDMKDWPRVQKYVVIPSGIAVLPFVIVGRTVYHRVLKAIWQKAIKRAFFAVERGCAHVYDKLVEINDRIA